MKADLLRAEIARAGKTQDWLAKKLGITPPVLSKKIREGRFGVDEAERITELLGIRDPGEIFLRSN